MAYDMQSMHGNAQYAPVDHGPAYGYNSEAVKAEIYTQSSLLQNQPYESQHLPLRRSQGCVPSLTFSWWYELLGATVSVAAMVAMVVVLQKYNNKPVDDWTYSITINTVIAAIATVVRTAFMIPVAAAVSQGKWLWFLPRRQDRRGKKLNDIAVYDGASRGVIGSLELLLRFKGKILVSIAAIVTILSIASDTFSQQVLTTVTNSIVEPLPNLSAAAVPRAVMYEDYTHAGMLTNLIPTWTMQAAVQNGILAANVSQLSASCSTGNCTFPVVPSLAVCSQCLPTTWTKSCNESTNSCDYTLPSGSSMSVSNNIASTTTFEIFSDASSEFSTTASIPYINYFEVLGMPFNSQAWNESKASAQSCALWFCVQSYQVSVKNNIQTVKVADTWDQVKSRTKQGWYNFTSFPDSMNVSPDDDYSVSYYSVEALNNAFQDIFVGKNTASGQEGIAYSDSWVQAIWAGFDDMNTTISNIAETMTNTLRSSNAVNATSKYAGTASKQVIYISVRWVWLLYPAVLVVLSILVLLGTMFQTRFNKIKPWKDDPVVLMLAGADEPLKRLTDGCLNDGRTYDEAVNATAILKRTGEHWSFHHQA